IFGPGLSSVLAEPLGTPALLLVSSGFLVLALGAASLLIRIQPAQGRTDDTGGPQPDSAVIGGGAWDGIKAVGRSPYLGGIAAYVVILAVMATFLYFTRLQMVAALGGELDGRTALFARIDV